jgi:hypothetical protein
MCTSLRTFCLHLVGRHRGLARCSSVCTKGAAWTWPLRAQFQHNRDFDDATLRFLRSPKFFIRIEFE